MYVQQKHKILIKQNLKGKHTYSIRMFLKQISQGLYVTVGAISSFLTLGYMINDNHKIEVKYLKNNYETEIKKLTDEIEKMKQERMLNLK